MLVVLDAARADHFGVYGYSRETTPVVDAFAATAVRYETAISDAAFTFLSVGSLMSAQSPAESGLSGRSGGRVPASFRLLAELAREAGFATGAYSENPFVTRYFGLDQGFEVFEEAFPVRAHLDGRELSEAHDSAGDISSVLDRVRADPKRPFFLYIHLLRPHNPYAPAPPFAGRFGSRPDTRAEGSTQALVELDAKGPPFDAKQIERVISLYDENLSQADSIFGFVLAALAEREPSPEPIVILAGDHGEAFGEQGRLLHSTQVYDPMIRIPLLVRVPGVEARVESRPVQLTDLGRALRAYFSVRVEPGGDDLLADLARERKARDPDQREPLYAWTNARTHLVAARTGSRKLIVDAQSLAPVAHHDLDADRAERHPLSLDAEGERVKALLVRQISRWSGASPPANEADPLPAEQRRQLEALGYEE